MLDSEMEPAAHPAEISPAGWGSLTVRAMRSALHHRAPSQAAGAAFYAMLAFMPAIAAFGSIYGLLDRPERLGRKLETVSGFVPPGVQQLITGEAMHFAAAHPSKLIGAAVLFALISLVSASSGVRQLMVGLNIAYRCKERRQWLHRRLLATGFAIMVMVGLGAGVGLVMRSSDFSFTHEPQGELVELVLKWLATFALSVAGLTFFYRYGPDRTRARWRWVTPGSALAAATGLVASGGASLYLAHFARYEHTYGGLGSMLALAIWLWTAMTVVLAGAELNYAMERQTSHDTRVTAREEEGQGS